jgi:hypothetical protein
LEGSFSPSLSSAGDAKRQLRRKLSTFEPSFSTGSRLTPSDNGSSPSSAKQGRTALKPEEPVKWSGILRPTRCADSCRLSERYVCREIVSGGSGIRTHGGFHLTAFQELRICPLCHPSSCRMLRESGPGGGFSAQCLPTPLRCLRGVLIPQTSTGPPALGLGEGDLAEPDDLGRHFDAFVVGDELERVLQGEDRDRGQSRKLLGGG